MNSMAKPMIVSAEEWEHERDELLRAEEGSHPRDRRARRTAPPAPDGHVQQGLSVRNAGSDVTLDDEVLDRIDEIAPPGTGAGPNDVAYTPPAISSVRLRRRPFAERSAA
jgi:hypothetical protein